MSDRHAYERFAATDLDAVMVLVVHRDENGGLHAVCQVNATMTNHEMHTMMVVAMQQLGETAADLLKQTGTFVHGG